MAEVERPARIMALDVGARRIGVAVSDLLGITAQGLDTIQRQNKRRDLETLRRLLAEYQIWLPCRYFSQAAPVLALFFPVPCI